MGLFLSLGKIHEKAFNVANLQKPRDFLAKTDEGPLYFLREV